MHTLLTLNFLGEKCIFFTRKKKRKKRKEKLNYCKSTLWLPKKFWVRYPIFKTHLLKKIKIIGIYTILNMTSFNPLTTLQEEKSENSNISFVVTYNL